MSLDDRTVEISDLGALPRQPLVSVYMLTYQHERFIAQAIEGVVAQKCDFAMELIIGEDCSPDGTRAIALDYQRRYPNLIRVLTSTRNVGIRANAARCREAVRGAYLALCEGDDFWHHPGKLQMQVEYFRKHPNITVCHTDLDRLIGRRRKRNMHTSHSSSRPAQGAAYADLLHTLTIMTATAMYPTALVREFVKTPFNRSDWPFGDYPLALFASTRGQVGFIPVSTAAWRKVLGSASNPGFKETLRLSTASLECKELFMGHYPVEPSIRNSVLRHTNLIVMRDAFYAGNIEAYRSALGNYRAAGGKPNSALHHFRVVATRTIVPLAVMQLIRRIFLFLSTR